MIDLKHTDRIKTFGDSMYPLLQNGDIVYYKKVLREDLVPNDLVIFKTSNQYITHRIIFITKECIITKGDNVSKADQPIKFEQVIGRVYKVKRNQRVINVEKIYLLQSIIYLKEIFELNRVFEKNHINFVFLKGLPLHLFYEGKFPRRLYADIDILVASEDFCRCQNLLFNLGYCNSQTTFGLGKNNHPVEINYQKKINGVPVILDLHKTPAFLTTQFDTTNIFYSQELLQKMTREFLLTKRYITIQNTKMPILGEVQLCMYLALHFFHHNYQGIHRLQFLGTVINKTFIDRGIKDKFWQLISMYNVENFIAPIVEMLRVYVDVDISQDIYKKSHFLLKITIFDEEPRAKAALYRLYLLIIKSKNPFYKKMEIFVYKALWESILGYFKKHILKK